MPVMFNIFLENIMRDLSPTIIFFVYLVYVRQCLTDCVCSLGWFSVAPGVLSESGMTKYCVGLHDVLSCLKGCDYSSHPGCGDWGVCREIVHVYSTDVSLTSVKQLLHQSHKPRQQKNKGIKKVTLTENSPQNKKNPRSACRALS